jgi:hypothetical protein
MDGCIHGLLGLHANHVGVEYRFNASCEILQVGAARIIQNDLCLVAIGPLEQLLDSEGQPPQLQSRQCTGVRWRAASMAD